MSRFDDLDRALDSYLDGEAAASHVPDDLLDVVRAASISRSPRMRWHAWLSQGGSTHARWLAPGGRVVAIAFVIVAVLVALIALGLTAGGRRPTLLSDVAPVPTASPVAAPSTAPVGTIIPILPNEPWIIYMAAIAGVDSDRLWLVRPDGTDRHRLEIATGRDGQQEHPDWAPDGSRIAFDQWYRDSATPGVDRVEIWSADADGGNPRRISGCTTPCYQLAYPAFSPDGSHLVVSRFDELVGSAWGRSAIEVIDLATGARQVVIESADGSTAYYTPRWSPDGTHLVFGFETYTDATQSTLVSASIAVVAADGTSPRPRIVTPPGLEAWEPDWNPSTDQIVFRTRFDPSDPQTRTTPTDIYVIHSDGTAMTNLTNLRLGAERAIQPTWTADGRRIVFTLIDGFGSGQIPLVALMDADGRNVSRLGFGDGTAGRLRPVP